MTKVRTPIVPYKRTPYPRVMSFAYPEVRTFYVSFFKQLASTGTRGIMIDLLRHPPIAGYEPIVTEAFRQKYGKDMEPLDVYHDPQVRSISPAIFGSSSRSCARRSATRSRSPCAAPDPNNFALRARSGSRRG